MGQDTPPTSGAEARRGQGGEGESSVLIVDDSMAIREVIAQMIEIRPGLRVVGSAVDGKHALSVIEQEEPDIIVIDVWMPRLTGLETVPEIKRRWPDTKVVVFTSASDEPTIGEIFRAGADAYVCKHDSWERLMDCLETLHSGRRWVSLILPEYRPSNT